MTATCGLTGNRSLTSAHLQSLLASKLQARSIGSILYRLTWKDRVTPSGRQICALRASKAPTSDNDFISSPWPTPATRDGKGGYIGGRMRNGKISTDTLDVAAQLATMAEPMRLCSDGRLLIGSSAAMESGGRLNPAHSRWLMRLPHAWDDCAPMAMRSTRKPQSNSVRRSKKSVTKLEYDL